MRVAIRTNGVIVHLDLAPDSSAMTCALVLTKEEARRLADLLHEACVTDEDMSMEVLG